MRVRRTVRALAALAMLAGCALPPNTALPDWARSASELAGQAVAEPEATRAGREALAVYLYALGVVAAEDVLTFRDAPYAALAARAATPAVGELGAVLRRARDANPDLEARANSAGRSDVIEDLRLRPMLQAADPPVQALVALLSAGSADPAERAVLARIGEGHALLAARAGSLVALGQRGTAREIRAAEEALLRAGARLPARDAAAAAAIAATVQP
jgi:hypothetical protein